MLDMEAFEERAAIVEFDGGLSRFEAETLAAQAQGLTRWQALREAANAKRGGNPATARNHGQAGRRDAADDLSRVQRRAAEENRPVPERHVQA